MYQENESFAHKLTKELVYKWLCDVEERSDDVCKFSNLYWRINQGVHMELKFHENDDIYLFELMPEDRGKILFVPDICIFHKGVPCILIEIIHTHPVSDEKFRRIYNFFRGSFSLYTVNVMDILKLTEIPTTKHKLFNLVYGS